MSCLKIPCLKVPCLWSGQNDVHSFSLRHGIRVWVTRGTSPIIIYEDARGISCRGDNVIQVGDKTLIVSDAIGLYSVLKEQDMAESIRPILRVLPRDQASRNVEKSMDGENLFEFCMRH